MRYSPLAARRIKSFFKGANWVISVVAGVVLGLGKVAYLSLDWGFFHRILGDQACLHCYIRIFILVRLYIISVTDLKGYITSYQA